jgi:hypothetical protein
LFKKLKKLLDNFHARTCGRAKFILSTGELPGTTSVDLSEYRQQMFINKTINEYNKLVTDNEFFKKFSHYKTVRINKIDYLNLFEIWRKIQNLIKDRLINNEPFTIIHGDCCFSNILSSARNFYGNDQTFFRFIDPRGSFGAVGYWGDPLYDLAKLRHSYQNQYEKIINNEFELDTHTNEFSIHYEMSKVPEDSDKLFADIFGADMLKVKLIEGLIWMGMIARHYDSLNRQKIMYATGIKCLNEVLECA